MPITLITRKKFRYVPETICLSCSRSWPQHCEFWRLQDSEAGIKAMGATAVKCKVVGAFGGYSEVYKVVECPHFSKMPLSETEIGQN